VNAVRYEYAAFVISGAFAGLAGALLVVLDQNSFPMLFHWTTSAEPLLMIVIGGATSFFGPLLGAAVVVFLRDYLEGVTSHINLIYGIAVLVIALGAPGGLAGLLRSGAGTLVRLVPGPRPGNDDVPPDAGAADASAAEPLGVTTRGGR
jgi:ABC-type branched-subunit amino acid transport system permease subunit